MLSGALVSLSVCFEAAPWRRKDALLRGVGLVPGMWSAVGPLDRSLLQRGADKPLTCGSFGISSPAAPRRLRQDSMPSHATSTPSHPQLCGKNAAFNANAGTGAVVAHDLERVEWANFALVDQLLQRVGLPRRVRNLDPVRRGGTVAKIAPRPLDGLNVVKVQPEKVITLKYRLLLTRSHNLMIPRRRCRIIYPRTSRPGSTGRRVQRSSWRCPPSSPRQC